MQESNDNISMNACIGMEIQTWKMFPFKSESRIFNFIHGNNEINTFQKTRIILIQHYPFWMWNPLKKFYTNKKFWIFTVAKNVNDELPCLRIVLLDIVLNFVKKFLNKKFVAAGSKSASAVTLLHFN
jgi:hypothetical protein